MFGTMITKAHLSMLPLGIRAVMRRERCSGVVVGRTSQSNLQVLSGAQPTSPHEMMLWACGVFWRGNNSHVKCVFHRVALVAGNCNRMSGDPWFS